MTLGVCACKRQKFDNVGNAKGRYNEEVLVDFPHSDHSNFTDPLACSQNAAPLRSLSKLPEQRYEPHLSHFFEVVVIGPTLASRNRGDDAIPCFSGLQCP